MGAAISTTNPADFANRLQKYFSRQLLKALQFNLKLGSYGIAKELPANSAANTIRFFRPRKASRAGVQALVEGTKPANLTEVAIGFVDIQLQQRGALAQISDIVRAIDLLDTLDVYTKTMGADAALDFDTVCSHAICSQAGQADADATANPIPVGQTTMYNSNTSFERFAGVANTGVSANDWATLNGNTTAQSKLTRAVHLGCMTQLRVNYVPFVNGKYPVVVPPQVLFDMRQDSTWISAAVFDAIKQRDLWNWAEFELDGGVFVEQNNPFTEKLQYGQFDSTGGIFSVLYLGDGAFGVPKLSSNTAGSDPRQPSMIVLSQPDKADPLNQIVTLGWKAFYQAGLLLTQENDVPHLVQLRCKATFS